MHYLGGVTAILGLVLLLVGHVGFLVAAFRVSVFWLIGMLIFPIVSLVFLVVEWDNAKRPFFLELWGLVLGLLGLLALR